MWADFYNGDPLVRHDQARVAQNSANRAWAVVRTRNEEIERLAADARLLASTLDLLVAVRDYLLAPDVTAAIERHRP